MRSYLRPLILLLVALPLLALAARPSNLEPLPDDTPPPPQTGADVPTAEPEVTIVEHDSTTFEEYRINGRLYKIKVIPKVGAPYYLIDDQGANVWRRYDGPVPEVQVPQWVILEF
ncbi:MAG: DUF2782 domain-containing protein [Ferrovum sp.]|nr:DUF2782 domain-containing protein [Ferrovum sp.]